MSGASQDAGTYRVGLALDHDLVQPLDIDVVIEQRCRTPTSHHLTRAGRRSHCFLIVETGKGRGFPNFALLVGYGATAINPYLAFETLQDMVNQGLLPGQDGNNQADEETDIVYHYTKNYIKAVGKGLLKVFSKMGISTLQSYCSAQIFEVVGLNQDFISKYFPGTASRIGGAGLNYIHITEGAGITGNDDNTGAGIAGLNMLQKLHPPHFRHHHIGDNNGKRLFLQNFHGLKTVVRLDTIEPKRLYADLQQFQCILIVVNK